MTTEQWTEYQYLSWLKAELGMLEPNQEAMLSYLKGMIGD